MSRVILITGATGQQGGSVLNALVEANPAAHDFTLVAITRNASSPSAQRLAQKHKSIRVIEGNLDDPKAIFESAKKAAGPVWGVFSVQLAFGGGASPESEERQGKALVDASIAAGVKVFVYSSVDRGGDKSTDNPTNVGHFISKHNIEVHLRSKTSNGEMKWTILRPTAFMEGLAPGFQTKVFVAAWRAIIKDKPLQLVATKDIGIMATKAFVDPDAYNGRSISLAGDELSLDQINKIFNKKYGKDLPITYAVFGHLLAFVAKDLGKMLHWFHDEGYGTNIPELRREHPGLLDFETWLEKESKWNA